MKLSFENYKRFKTGVKSTAKVDSKKARGSALLALEFFENIIKPNDVSEVLKNAAKMWEEVRKSKS